MEHMDIYILIHRKTSILSESQTASASLHNAAARIGIVYLEKLISRAFLLLCITTHLTNRLLLKF